MDQFLPHQLICENLRHLRGKTSRLTRVFAGVRRIIC